MNSNQANNDNDGNVIQSRRPVGVPGSEVPFAVIKGLGDNNANKGSDS